MEKIFQSSLKTALLTTLNLHRELLVFYWSALIIFLIFCFRVNANEDINMNDVRKLAKLSVDEILENSPIDTFSIENYWSNVHGRNKPLIVFFYSNFDGPSQRLATLIRYLALS